MEKSSKSKSRSKKGMEDTKSSISELKRLCSETEDINEIIQLSRHEDKEVRFAAVKQFCPCKVRKDIEEFWDRVFEMINDEDPRIRGQILHTICDGSPEHIEIRVSDALEKFNQDPDKDIRRKAHKVLASYIRTGKWNIL